MEGQLSVIQNILNPGKQVSKITSNQFSPYFLFLQSHTIFIPSGHQQRAEDIGSLNGTTTGWIDQPQHPTKAHQKCTLHGIYQC